MEIARLLTSEGNDAAESEAVRGPVAHARPRPEALVWTNAPTRRRTALEKLREQAKALEWVAAHSHALFQDHTDPVVTIGVDDDVGSIRRHLHQWRLAQDRQADELQIRQVYMAKLRQYQQSSTAISKLMRGLELDDWYWKCERWQAITREYYKPFTRAECGQLLHATMKTMAAYTMPKEVKQGEKPSAFGWRDMRGLVRDQRSVHFKSQKTVCGVNLDETIAACLEVYQDAAQFKKYLLGERIPLFFQLLQREKLQMRIREGVVEEVLFLQMVGGFSGLPALVHALDMVFLVKTETGYMLGSHAVESPDLQRAMRGEGMGETFTLYWTRWDVTARDKETGVSTEFVARFRGFIGATVPGYAQLWATEGLLSLVRLDRKIYGTKPLVSLPSAISS